MVDAILEIRIDARVSSTYSHRICFENLARLLASQGTPIRSVPTGSADEPAVRALIRGNPRVRSIRIPVEITAEELPLDKKGFTHKLIFCGLRDALEAELGALDFESTQAGQGSEVAMRIGFVGTTVPVY
jgi:hypothetical protein